MQILLPICRYDESFIIRDATYASIFTEYYESERDRQNATKRMDGETAREMAKRIARLLSDVL